jgi:hypothetical protein
VDGYEGYVVFPAAAAMINALVRGPTAPYPVVSGAPEETIPFLDCQLWTAISVSGPKKPVAGP